MASNRSPMEDTPCKAWYDADSIPSMRRETPWRPWGGCLGADVYFALTCDVKDLGAIGCLFGCRSHR